MTSPGYCKVCASPLVKAINKQLKDEKTYDSIVIWCDQREFNVTRQKLGDHKKHITDPKETLVDHARRNPEIRNGVTDDEFSQAIIDLAYQNAMANPEDITINHGIQIVKARAAKKQGANNLMLIFAERSMGRLPGPQPELIDGSFVVVEESIGS